MVSQVHFHQLAFNKFWIFSFFVCNYFAHQLFVEFQRLLVFRCVQSLWKFLEVLNPSSLLAYVALVLACISACLMRCCIGLLEAARFI